MIRRHQGGEHVLGDLGRGQHVLVPGQVVAGRVIEAGDRGRTGVNRPVACKALDHIGIAVSELVSRLPHVGLVLLDPEAGTEGRASRHGEVTTFPEEFLLTDSVAYLARLGPRPSIAKQDRRPERLALSSHRDQSRGRHRERDDADRREVLCQFSAALSERCPPFDGFNVGLALVVEIGIVAA